MLEQEEVPELLRQLRRVPHGQGRARLLNLVLARFPSAPGEAAVVVTREGTATGVSYTTQVMGPRTKHAPKPEGQPVQAPEEVVRALEDVEPIDVDVEEHLRWLETGKGVPWPRASSG